jgi:dihydrofolate reductase
MVGSDAAGNFRELLFGRKTYEMMASFWPSPAAMEQVPSVAEGMNKAKKVVFSRTLARADWNNTRLFKDDLAGTVRKLKSEAGGGMCILGSGEIVAQLTEAGLIDEFHNVITPNVLGAGRTQFEGVTRRIELDLVSSRPFVNGNVLAIYKARK